MIRRKGCKVEIQIIKNIIRNGKYQGAWMAQSVKLLNLNLGLGHDLTVSGIEPQVRLCMDSVEPA